MRTTKYELMRLVRFFVSQAFDNLTTIQTGEFHFTMSVKDFWQTYEKNLFTKKLLIFASTLALGLVFASALALGLVLLFLFFSFSSFLNFNLFCL